MERNSNSDDSDDEPVVSRRKVAKKVLEDSEDDDGGGMSSDKETEDSKNGVKAAAASLKQIELSGAFKDVKDYDSDKENINPGLLRAETRGVPSAIFEDDSSQSSSTPSNMVLSVRKSNVDPEQNSVLRDSRKPKLLEDDNSDIENGHENSQPLATSSQSTPVHEVKEQSNKNRIIKNDRLLSELFDAEESEEENNSGEDEEEERKDIGYESETSDNEAPKEMSDELKKRLAKGASKKPSKEKKPKEPKVPRINKEEIQELHSESQRMVREKEVSVPYHKPKKLGLDVFLARTKHKQEVLQTIKGPKQVGWKKTPIISLRSESKASSKTRIDLTKDKLQTHSLDILRTKSAVEKDSIANTDELPDLVHRLHEKQNKISAEESEQLSVDKVRKVLKLSNTDDLVESRSLDSQSESRTDWKSDLMLENINEMQQSCVKSMETDFCDSGIEKTQEGETVALTDDIVSTTLIKNSESQERALPEPDSGYLTTPVSSGEDSNSSVKNDSEVTPQANDGCVNNDKNEQLQTEEASGDKTECCEETMDTESSTFTAPQQNDEEAANAITVENDTPKTLNLKTEAKRKRMTPKLAELGLQEVKPRLSGGPDSFIDLEEDCDTPKQDPGVMNLIERFMKHSSKRPKAKAKDVELSTVTKEKDGDQEQLKLEKFTYHIQSDEEEDTEAKPGAKLVKLKTKLKEQMAKDREKARQLRSQAEQYDNEEGFEDAEEEEEEAEMTDESETSEDEIDEEEELDDDEYGADEKPSESNPFVDREAEDEDDEEEEDGLHLQLDTNDQEESEQKDDTRKGFLEKALKKTKSLPLFDDESQDISEVSNQESGTISDRPFGQLGQSAKDGEDEEKEKEGTADEANVSFKDMSADSSFELMGSMLPAAQRSSKKPPVSPSSRSTSSVSSKARNLEFPIESTQDLFNNLPASPTQVKSSAHPDSQNEDYNFRLEESQSVMLDEDGFLQVNSAKKPRRKLHMSEQLLTAPIADTQGAMGEALGLCSGNFSSVNNSKDKMATNLLSTQGGSMDDLMALCSGKFTAPVDKSDSKAASGMGVDDGPGMSQLLGLCSGRFTAEPTQQQTAHDGDEDAKDEQKETSQTSKNKKRTAVIEESDDEDEGEEEEENDDQVEEDFIVESGDESEPAEASEAEEVEDEEYASDGGEIVKEELGWEEGQETFTGFFDKSRGKKKVLRQDFVDEEAELSGSEAESDEDDNLDDAMDIMEEEAGDHDVNMTEEALRNQVTRVHMKTVLDQDDREIRYMKEYYLEDGDLHSEGGGRERRFKWAHLDEAIYSGGMNLSDTEEQKEEDPSDEKWRRDRFEREKFLREQKEKEEEKDEIEEIAPALKLGNVTYKPKKCVKPLQEKVVTQQRNVAAQKPKDVGIAGPQNLFKKPKFRAGSFLTRSKETLSKIAELSKPIGNIKGPTNSRNLLFSTKSKEEVADEDTATEMKKPQLKRSVSTPTQPAAKKQKIDRQNTIPSDSIFKLL